MEWSQPLKAFVDSIQRKHSSGVRFHKLGTPKKRV